MKPDDPIEDYLDELLVALRLSPRHTRELLAEAEDHLRQSSESLVTQGLEPVVAAKTAVRRFGSAREVAAAASHPPRVLATLAWAALALGGVGLVGIGVSGALAAVGYAIGGPHFMGAIPQTYPASVCRYYLQIHPSATTCAQAAALEVSDDAGVLRGAAGVLGVLAVVVALWWRGRLVTDRSMARVRDGAVSAIGAVAFGVAAVLLTVYSAQLAVQQGSGGVGFFLSGAVASYAGVLACVAYSLRQLRGLHRWRFTGDA